MGPDRIANCRSRVLTIASVAALLLFSSTGCQTGGGGGGGGGGGDGGGGGPDFTLDGEFQAVYDQAAPPSDCFEFEDNTLTAFELSCQGNILLAPAPLNTVNDTRQFTITTNVGTLTFTFRQVSGELRVTRQNAGGAAATGRLIAQ